MLPERKLLQEIPILYTAFQNTRNTFVITNSLAKRGAQGCRKKELEAQKVPNWQELNPPKR